MNAMTKTEENEIQTARIRMLQAMHYDAHKALEQWGLWSMDKRGIYPTLSPPGMWEQYRRDGTEGYADEANATVVVAVGPAKAERADHEDYDEKLAIALDERMHGFGGLSEMIRQTIKTAYATREVPEYQFPLFANCSTLDQFCERLEAGLRFAARWV